MLIVDFMLDAIYRKEICREDIITSENGNILIDGFDYFGELEFGVD